MTRISDRAHLRIRLLVALVLGIVAGSVVTPLLGITAGLIAAWGVIALVSAVWVLLRIWPMDPEQTRAHVISEDPGRRVTRLVAIVGSVMSLVAIGVVAAQAQYAEGVVAYSLAAIALLSVMSSWLLI